MSNDDHIPTREGRFKVGIKEMLICDICSLECSPVSREATRWLILDAPKSVKEHYTIKDTVHGLFCGSLCVAKHIATFYPAKISIQ